jgi:lysophospholipid acyltransferase (LPLAT)-like uncharacterized protein
MNEVDYSNSLIHRVVPVLAGLYLNFVGWTGKITIKNKEILEQTKKQYKNFIYALWHCQEILLIFLHRNQKIYALVSKSKDGEYMNRILQRFGYMTIRGSTSTGAAMSVRSLIRCAKQGNSIALTPDGPKGPPRKIKHGITYLAQKASVPIIPIACALSRKLIINNWEPYMVPLPWTKGIVIYGNPIFVTETDTIEDKSLELENTLNLLTEEANKELKT